MVTVNFLFSLNCGTTGFFISKKSHVCPFVLLQLHATLHIEFSRIRAGMEKEGVGERRVPPGRGGAVCIITATAQTKVLIRRRRRSSLERRGGGDGADQSDRPPRLASPGCYRPSPRGGVGQGARAVSGVSLGDCHAMATPAARAQRVGVGLPDAATRPAPPRHRPGKGSLNCGGSGAARRGAGRPILSRIMRGEPTGRGAAAQPSRASLTGFPLARSSRLPSEPAGRPKRPPPCPAPAGALEGTR